MIGRLFSNRGQTVASAQSSRTAAELQPQISDRSQTVAGAQSSRTGAEIQIQNAARGIFTFPNEIKVDDTKCIICQEEFNTGLKPEIPLALPGCGHVFGSVCISQWLHTVERNHGCPLCRGKLFGSLRENVIVAEGEEEQNAGDEEDDAVIPMTPIDAPFVLSDLADELQGWEPFQVDQQSAGTSQGLDPPEAPQVNLINQASQFLVEDGRGIVEELTAAALRYFLGDYPSTEAVIDAVRTRHIVNYGIAIETIVDDHRHMFTGNPDQRPSYSEQTRLAYQFVQTALQRAARWLRERPPHNDMHPRGLYIVLEGRLRAHAANFRGYELVKLTDLIKAGIFSSPQMQGSFDDRMRMSQYVPGDIESLRNAEPEPRPYMAQWVRAMPLLTSAVQQIAELERINPLRIIDIDCERLWNLDVEAIPPVVLPDRTLPAAQSALDFPPAPVVDPIVPPLASSTQMESESEASRTNEREGDHPQLG